MAGRLWGRMKQDLFANRLWQRRRFDFRVRVQVAARTGPLEIHGRTRDLSFGGLGVVLTRELPEGTPAIISLRAPSLRRNQLLEHPLELRFPAILRYRRGFTCGFQFERLTPEARLFVQQLHRALPA